MKKFIFTLCIGLLLSLVIFLLSWLSPFEAIELKIRDQMFNKLRSIKPDDRIAIVFVSQDLRTAAARDMYAKLIFKYRGASAIGFDFVMPDYNESLDKNIITASIVAKVYCSSFGKRGIGAEEDIYIDENLAELANRFKWNVPIKGVGRLPKPSKNEIVSTYFEFSRHSTGMGHIFTARKQNEILRKIPLVVELEGNLYPLLSLQIICDLLNVKEKEVYLGKYIKLITSDNKEVKVPIDKNGCMYINYIGKFEQFERTYNIEDMIKTNISEDNIILVGAGPKDKDDVCKTPFGEYPGVGIHATVLDNILRKDFLHQANTAVNLISSILLGSVTGVIMTRTFRKRDRQEGEKSFMFSDIQALTGILLVFLLSIVYVGIAILLFKFMSVLIEITSPLAVWLIIILGCIIILICQIDVKITNLLKADDKGKKFRYLSASIIFILSIVLFILTYKNQYAVAFPILLFWTSLRIGGLISAGKFEDQIGKFVDKITPKNGNEN